MRAIHATAAWLAMLLVAACTQPTGPAGSTSSPRDAGATNGPALGRDEFPAGTDASVAAHPAANAAVSSASAGATTGAAAPSADPRSRVFVDPVTGDLRAPTAAELAAEAAGQSSSTRSAAALKAAPAITVTPLPNGMTEYDVGEAGQVREQVCAQADGSLADCARTPPSGGSKASGSRRP